MSRRNRLKERFNLDAASWTILTVLVLAIVSFMGWMTHVVICIKAANWIFLIVGAIAFPVAVAHGIGHWFGVW